MEIKDNEWTALKGKAAIDWFELAACIQWDESKAGPWFKRLLEVREVAQEHRRPATLTIGTDMVAVATGGIGGGRDAYKEIQLTWNDVRVGLSERNGATRQFSNGSLQVSGSPCLVTGAGVAWDFFVRLVRTLGGKISDEWLRRLDVCVDLPELSFPDVVYPLLRDGHVNTRCRSTKLSLEGDNSTGYSVGKSNRLRVSIYDKLFEALHKQDPVYLSAMMQRRWGGLPSCATRVEWQMGRPYLKQFGLDTAQETMKRMPDLFDKLTADPGGAFRLTATKPDKENKHQSRAATHPLWERVIEIGRTKIGRGNEPLKRLDRTKIDETRAIAQIIGYVTSIADRRQTFCETKGDILRVVSETMEHHRIEDSAILDSFMKKAKASGTWQDMFGFPGKGAA
ncbi:hypothetical protein [Fuerstiella marisgermanici]|nr:hypothetical protein [Fuerstiella marisgermanici]